MKIEESKVVTLTYKVYDEDNQLVEEVTANDPLTYMQGEEVLLPKIEVALLGKNKGDTVVVELDAKDAYGEYDESLANRPFDKSLFGENQDSIELGHYFQIEGVDGLAIAKVIGFDGDKVLLDLNQPLAGKKIKFEFLVHDVREPTEDELENGVAYKDFDNSHSCGPNCSHQH